MNGFGAYHEEVSQPVEIRGVVYRSCSEASKRLGVSTSAIRHAKKKGKLQEVALVRAPYRAAVAECLEDLRKYAQERPEVDLAPLFRALEARFEAACKKQGATGGD